MVGLGWRFAGFSSECLVQPEDSFVREGGKVCGLNVEATGRPNASQAHPLIPVAAEVDIGAVERVRAKLPNNHGRDLHITVFRPYLIRW